MPKAQAIQINWQFTGSTGIMQVGHSKDVLLIVKVLIVFCA